jgi:hypothetical protein
MRSSGSLNASTTDVLKYIRFLLDGGRVGDKVLLSRASLDQMWTPHVMMPYRPQTQAFSGLDGYGLAWFLGTYRGHDMISHGGAAAGYHAFMALFPEDNLGVFLVHNGSAFLSDAIVRDIVDIYLGAPPVDWYASAKKDLVAYEAVADLPPDRVPDTKPSHSLDQYAGEYIDPGYGSLVVEFKNGALYGRYNGSKEFALEHWHYDTFRASKPLGWLGTPAAVRLLPTFQADPVGRISALTIPLEPTLGPVIFTRKPDR